MDNNKINYPEVFGRLLMILTGFVLVMLGFITFMHASEHRVLGILICFAGTATMFGGFPDHD